MLIRSFIMIIVLLAVHSGSLCVTTIHTITNSCMLLPAVLILVSCIFLFDIYVADLSLLFIHKYKYTCTRIHSNPSHMIAVHYKHIKSLSCVCTMCISIYYCCSRVCDPYVTRINRKEKRTHQINIHIESESEAESHIYATYPCVCVVYIIITITHHNIRCRTSNTK